MANKIVTDEYARKALREVLTLYFRYHDAMSELESALGQDFDEDVIQDAAANFDGVGDVSEEVLTTVLRELVDDEDEE